MSLHPDGYESSVAYAVEGGVQAGYVVPAGETDSRAALWYGSASSYVDITPEGYFDAEVRDMSGGVQVGWAVSENDGSERAMMWRGSADTAYELHPPFYGYSFAEATDGKQVVGSGRSFAVDERGSTALLWDAGNAFATRLHPEGFRDSFALAVAGGVQVGEGYLEGELEPTALAWFGTAESVVGLSAFLPEGYGGSSAVSVDSAGNIYGYAWDAPQYSFDVTPRLRSVVWRPVVVPEPGVLFAVVGVMAWGLGRRRG
ncbi:MAG: hypothetical protein AAF823_00525 [Planctomycetota bacterium]